MTIGRIQIHPISPSLEEFTWTIEVGKTCMRMDLRSRSSSSRSIALRISRLRAVSSRDLAMLSPWDLAGNNKKIIQRSIISSLLDLVKRQAQSTFLSHHMLNSYMVSRAISKDPGRRRVLKTKIGRVNQSLLATPLPMWRSSSTSQCTLRRPTSTPIKWSRSSKLRKTS